MTDIEGLLTRTQAAQRAGCSTERIDWLRRQGRLRALETPLGRLYQPSEVDAVAMRRELQPA